MSESNLRLEDLITNAGKTSNTNRIETVAIIGAGVMGRGIAQTIAAAGYDVLVIEKSEQHLTFALDALKEVMSREIARWSMTSSEMKSILTKIKWSLDINDVATSDLIIEAIDENLEKKQNIFREIDAIAKENAIFVSNTSALNLSDISAFIKRKDRGLENRKYF